jgi:hypothetical protein
MRGARALDEVSVPAERSWLAGRVLPLRARGEDAMKL